MTKEEILLKHFDAKESIQGHFTITKDFSSDNGIRVLLAMQEYADQQNSELKGEVESYRSLFDDATKEVLSLQSQLAKAEAMAEQWGYYLINGK